jgi:hypothetical protein
MAVGSAEGEELADRGRDEQPAVVRDGRDRQLLGERQLPRRGSVGDLQRHHRLGFDEE